MDQRTTASIIIIGDEILKGQVKDTNSHFLCKELYKLGVKVPCITVIADDVTAIAEAVLAHSQKYTFVLTSGGIGPTHDDVTYEGMAKAFDEKLILNKDLESILSQFCLNMGWSETAASTMSYVPESSEIHRTGNFKNGPSIPIISVRNVFIFPGIPFYLEFAFSKLRKIFCKSVEPYFNQNLYILRTEFDLAEILNEAVKEYDGRVKFGSYPAVELSHYDVRLTLEADAESSIVEAEAFLRSHLSENSVVGKYPANSKESLKLILDICKRKSSSDNLTSVVKESWKVLEEAFDKYSPDEVCLSFNGGKDCTILLHISYLFLLNKYSKRFPKLKLLYVTSEQPFHAIEDFIKLSVERYNLELLSYEPPIKDALQKLRQDNPAIKAILMGSRSTDFHCSNLEPFQMTDKDWPQFMRISPLYNWDYPQVWQFLRQLQVPYCSLYDQGYTSVGCRHNTAPNAELLATTKSGQSYYLPAYLLKEPGQERKGRLSKN